LKVLRDVWRTIDCGKTKLRSVERFRIIEILQVVVDSSGVQRARHSRIVIKAEFVLNLLRTFGGRYVALSPSSES
jgi:hypothetical protein